MRLSSTAALLAALLALPTALFAQPADDGKAARARDEARALAQEGLARLDANDPRSAIRLFEQAEAKFHAPTHLLYLAQAHASLGEKVLAARLYERLVSEELPNYAPDAFREAQKIGKTELGGLAAELGRVRLVGRGEGVRIDGEVVTESVWYVAPGAHEVRFEGGIERIDLAPGAEVEIDVAPPAAVAPAPPVTEPGVRPLTLAGIITLSVGGAAAVAGGVTGGLSLAKVDELSERCPSKRGCDPRDESLVDDAKTLGDTSTALLVIGGAAFVTGLVLVLVPADDPEPSGSPTSFRPLVGPGFVGLDLTF